jgi:hypothetical protein
MLLLACAVCIAAEQRAQAACESAPPLADDVVVHVAARDHQTLGFVYGAPDLIVVPYAATEIDRPGETDLDVVDAAGAHHRAVVVASSSTSGVAVARANAPLAKTPLTNAPPAPRSSTEPASACHYSVHHESRGTEKKGPRWVLHDYEATRERSRLEAKERARAIASGDGDAAPAVRPDSVPRVNVGSPVLDERGALVGMIGMRDFPSALATDDAPLTIERDAVDALVQAPAASPPERRPIVFYFGMAGEADFSARGGLWGGPSFSVAARYRDLAELRVDAATVYLLPTADGYKQCAEPPCLAGVRGVVTPAIGPRIELWRDPRWPVVVTPQMGVAFGAQSASGGASGGPAADVGAPTTFMMAAPGATVAVGPLEVRGRVRLPHADTRDASYELGLGFQF